MATVNKSSLRAEFDALKARFESLCAAGKMSAESRALFDALLMLFELLMAVFMGKAHAQEQRQLKPPRLSEPQRQHRPHPSRRQGQGPLIQRGALRQHPHPRIRQGAQRRCVRALWRRPHRRRLHRPRAAHPHRHRVREGRASRRRTNQALPALPRRDARTLPPRDARTPAVRPRHQGLRRAPAHRADALAQTRRTIDARPHRAHPLRGHAPWLPRPAPSRARRVGAPCHRTPARLTGDARRRDLVARGPEKSLDSRLQRRHAHREVPAPQTRVRGHRGHRHPPALRRCGGARLLGLVSELHALRPRLVRGTSVAANSPSSSTPMATPGPSA